MLRVGINSMKILMKKKKTIITWTQHKTQKRLISSQLFILMHTDVMLPSHTHAHTAAHSDMCSVTSLPTASWVSGEES